MSKATRERMRVVKDDLPRRHACTLVLKDTGDGGFTVRGTFGHPTHPRFEVESPAHCAMRVLLEHHIPTLGERVELPATEAAIQAALQQVVSGDVEMPAASEPVVQLLDAQGSPLTH